MSWIKKHMIGGTHGKKRITDYWSCYWFSCSRCCRLQGKRKQTVRMALSQKEFPFIAARAFWLFVICSVGGLVIEEIYHFVVFGEFQDRAGLLFGPFSPIYGIGGMCITAVASPLRNKPLPALFFVFCITGGLVEYIVSFVLEFAFGITAWDYTGSFLAIDGRTNAYFMFMWGFLGLICAKVAVPAFEKYLVPIIDKLSPIVTAIAFTFMALNIVLTLVSFNCWFHRMEGNEPSTPIQIACAQTFGNDFMENRFQTMDINPNEAER